MDIVRPQSCVVDRPYLHQRERERERERERHTDRQRDRRGKRENERERETKRGNIENDQLYRVSIVLCGVDLGLGLGLGLVVE